MLLIGAAANAWEALAMPFDLAIELLAARRRRIRRERNAAAGSPGSGPASEDGKMRQNPDGSVSLRIGSMDSLRSLLARPLV